MNKNKERDFAIPAVISSNVDVDCTISPRIDKTHHYQVTKYLRFCHKKYPIADVSSQKSEQCHFFVVCLGG